MTSQDLAVVVDDAVLAGMLERRAVAHCRTDRRQVRVAIARRVAHVRITPTSGSPIDIEDARAALDAVLLDAGVEPPLKLVVQVDKEGVLRP